MTVQELESKMSIDEFIEWAIYSQIQSDRQKQAMNKNGSNNARNPVNRKR
jgi:hypothetical protein